MTLKIIKEIENPLFNRKEIVAEIGAEVVPKTAEALELVAKKFSAPQETIAIKKVIGKFGSKIFEIKASIYKTLEEKEKIEPKAKAKKEKAAPAEGAK